MHRVWSVVAVPLALANGCRGQESAAGKVLTSAEAAVDAGAPARAAGDALRDEGRLVLERHCGQCHVRDSPEALPRALAVYDLREPDWSARMSDAQLHSAVWRLGEPLPPDGNANDVSADERAGFQRYVDAELARRARLDGGTAR
jgi:cytochrome c5